MDGLIDILLVYLILIDCRFIVDLYGFIGICISGLHSRLKISLQKLLRKRVLQWPVLLGL